MAVGSIGSFGWLMLYVSIWGVCALGGAALAGVLAGLKNRDYSVWMGWAFLFPPIVIVYAFLPPLPVPRPRRPTWDEMHRYHDHL